MDDSSYKLNFNLGKIHASPQLEKAIKILKYISENKQYNEKNKHNFLALINANWPPSAAR